MEYYGKNFSFYDRPFYISKKKSIIFDCFFHYKIPFLFFINSNLDIEWLRFVYNIQFYHILPILDFLLPDSKQKEQEVLIYYDETRMENF